MLNKLKNIFLDNNIKNNNTINLKNTKKIIQLLPCYNESKKEMLNTINSLCIQNNKYNVDKILLIICDGKINTHNILLDIFSNYITYAKKFVNAYKTWDNKWNNLEVYSGIYNDNNFIILIKDKNIGKRDSITLIRRSIYYYNNREKSDINNLKNYIDITFLNNIFKLYDNPNKNNIDFIFGVDADTILDIDCCDNLLDAYYNFDNSDLVGIVGMVDIVKNWYNPLNYYQYTEYLYAQCLKRKVQSEITNKVNCLSGCNQLLKVCKETCGDDILNIFNRLPERNENIINHILSYASEDRNHICLMFQLYPYVKTIQATNAIAYTNVPDNLIKLLRQRKRWSLGSTVNDTILIKNKNHVLWERVNSFINIFTFSLIPFIFIASIHFVITIFTHPSLLLLYLSIMMMIPFAYSLLIPVLIYNNGNTNKEYFKNILYYYIGVLFYYGLGYLLILCIYFYSLKYIDDLNWNNKKINNANNKNNNFIINTNNYIEDNYIEDVYVSINENQTNFNDKFYDIIISNIKIGIIGIGVLGNALKRTFEYHNINIVCYDKYKNIGNNVIELLDCDMIFLCLPTLYNGKEYDKESIYETIDVLAENNYKGYVILKSTVEPKTTITLQNLYKNIKLFHNPEFLSSKTAYEDYLNQTHIVIGLPVKMDIKLIELFFIKYFPNAEISITNSDESEMMKIVCNSFYATKIQYFTEIKLLCDKLDINYNNVKELILKNGWINPMHTTIPGHDGKLSFGGACFPKDIRALNEVFKKYDVDNEVLQAVIDENTIMRDDI